MTLSHESTVFSLELLYLVSHKHRVTTTSVRNYTVVFFSEAFGNDLCRWSEFAHCVVLNMYVKFDTAQQYPGYRNLS